MHYARYLSDIFLPQELENGDAPGLQTKKERKTAKNAKKKFAVLHPEMYPFAGTVRCVLWTDPRIFVKLFRET